MMISREVMTKNVRRIEKIFPKCEKNDFKKDLPALLQANSFMFVLLISNHTVFLIQFVINLHRSGSCNFSILKQLAFLGRTTIYFCVTFLYCICTLVRI